ncbi:hypothetical protein QOT17_009763 [Balamuthia mandrillaris]
MGCGLVRNWKGQVTGGSVDCLDDPFVSECLLLQHSCMTASELLVGLMIKTRSGIACSLQIKRNAKTNKKMVKLRMRHPQKHRYHALHSTF